MSAATSVYRNVSEFVARTIVPVPLVVKLFAVVGFGLVLQHTPLAVMAEPPSLLILPPLLAVVAVIALTAVVLKMGVPSVVVNCT